MNSGKLEELLKKHAVPEPRPEIVEKHLNQARLAFTYAAPEPAAPALIVRSWWLFQGSLIGAAVCLLALLALTQTNLLGRPLPIHQALSSGEQGVLGTLTSSVQNSSFALTDALQVLFPAQAQAGPARAVVIEVTRRGKTYTVAAFAQETLYLHTADGYLQVRPELQPDGAVSLSTGKGRFDGGGPHTIDGLIVRVRALPNS